MNLLLKCKVIAVLLVLAVLSSCMTKPAAFTPGEFILDSKRSGFKESLGELGGFTGDVEISPTFTKNRRLVITQLGVEGTWTELNGELMIAVKKYLPVVAAMENVSSSKTAPIQMKWRIVGPDELEYYPTNLNNKRPFVMVFVRKS